MRTLDRTNSHQWLRSKGFRLGQYDEISFDTDDVMTVSQPVARARGFLGQVANIVMSASEKPFEGGFLYLRCESQQPEEWSSFFGVADKTFALLRQMPNDAMTAERCPGQYFSASELPEALSFTAQVVLFGIDAYFVPEGAEYLVHLSHDDVLSVGTKQKKWKEVFAAIFRSR